jgi:hypothetical protein
MGEIHPAASPLIVPSAGQDRKHSEDAGNNGGARGGARSTSQSASVPKKFVIHEQDGHAAARPGKTCRITTQILSSVWSIQTNLDGLSRAFMSPRWRCPTDKWPLSCACACCEPEVHVSRPVRPARRSQWQQIWPDLLFLPNFGETWTLRKKPRRLDTIETSVLSQRNFGKSGSPDLAQPLE